MSVYRIIELAKKFREEEAITELESREFVALINPLLSDNTEEYQEQFELLMSFLENEELVTQVTLAKMLHFFAERREYLIKPRYSDPYPRYSYLFAIPIIFENSPTFYEKRNKPFIIQEFLNLESLENHQVILYDKLVNMDFVNFSAREMALVHTYFFSGKDTNNVEDTLSQLHGVSDKEHTEPHSFVSVRFIVGVLVSETPLDTDSFMFETNTEWINFQTKIAGKFSKQFKSNALVLSLNYLHESLQQGICTQHKVNVLRNIMHLKKEIDNPKAVIIQLGVNSDKEKITATAMLNNIPLLTLDCLPFSYAASFTENIDQLRELFATQDFTKFELLD